MWLLPSTPLPLGHLGSRAAAAMDQPCCLQGHFVGFLSLFWS